IGGAALSLRQIKTSASAARSRHRLTRIHCQINRTRQESVMNSFIFKIQATVLASLLSLTGCGKSQATANQTAAASPKETTAPATSPVSEQKYSDDELDEML